MEVLTRLLCVTLLISLLCARGVAADRPTEGDAYRDHLRQQATTAGLASQRYWLNLLHYYSPLLSLKPLVSYVDDPDFFLAREGKTDPHQELLATIDGLFADPSLGNDHPMCRFPARTRWLVETLSIDPSAIANPLCADYLEWRAQVNATRVSLIFPSAYINSPSSMFGHTLFRFDPENVEEGTDWLSWSLSFGANIDASDSSIAFAYRGIFGGYAGIYTMMHYFQKIKEYNHLENRDIWEYELDLDAAQVDAMLIHVWEMKEIRFDYYFLDENCAFRLLELIELVRSDARLTAQFGATAIPADTVRAVIEEGLTTSVTFKPSATTELQSRIGELSDTEADMARALSDSIEVLDSPAYQDLPNERKARVVQVAYSFLRYRQLKILRDETLAERSHALLKELNGLPADRHQVAVPRRPEEGHKTRMFGLTTGMDNDRAYGQLDLRVTYHDLLDNPVGYPRGAQIAMGNSEIRYTEGGDLALNRFDLIDIVSLSEIDRFLASPSWHVKTGYERVFAPEPPEAGQRTGAYYVKAGGGAATRIPGNLTVYAFLDARLESNSHFKTFLTPAAGVSGGLLGRTPWGTTRTGVESDYFANDEYRATFSIEQNVEFGANDALRLGYFSTWMRGQQNDELRLSYRHHF